MAEVARRAEVARVEVERVAASMVAKRAVMAGLAAVAGPLVVSPAPALLGTTDPGPAELEVCLRGPACREERLAACLRQLGQPHLGRLLERDGRREAAARQVE